MDYEERLTTLENLYKDLSKMLADALVSDNMPEAVESYRLQMEQIENEIKRIQLMRGYKRS